MSADDMWPERQAEPQEAVREQQSSVRRNVKYTLAEIIEATGLSDSLVRTRLKRGASLAEAIRPQWYCENCDGKGYATYRSAYSGHDTDTDIGSPGGRYYQPYEEMRFCVCDRGKQLQQLIRQR